MIYRIEVYVCGECGCECGEPSLPESWCSYGCEYDGENTRPPGKLIKRIYEVTKVLISEEII